MKKYPISEASKQTLTYAATVAVVCTDSVNMVEVALTGDMTLNLDASSTPNPGDVLVVKASSDGTARDVTFGTNITGPILAGVINKTLCQTFMYDGSAFIAISAPVQID